MIHWRLGGFAFSVPSTTFAPRETSFRVFRSAIHALADPLSTLLLPAPCGVCQQPLETFSWTPVCDPCWEQVRPYEGLECAHCGMFLGSALGLHDTPLCGLCRRGSYRFHQARSFAWYDGVLAEVIRRFKYNSWLPLTKPLARCLHAALGRMNSSEENQCDLILPIPLHRNRQRHRGFNQSELLASRLAKLTGIPSGARDCVRVRDTPPQTGLRGAERRKNVRGAFAVPHPERVRDASILLIDDVLTTGATLDACAAALLEAGAARVTALTLARARPGWRDVI